MATVSGVETAMAEQLHRIEVAWPRTPIRLAAPTLEALLRHTHAQVDAMLGTLTDGSDLGDLRARIAEVERLSRRVDALKLRLVARATKTGATTRAGHTDSGSWLAGATDSDRHTSASDADLADALGDTPAQPGGEGATDRDTTGTGTGPDDGTNGTNGEAGTSDEAGPDGEAGPTGQADPGDDSTPGEPGQGDGSDASQGPRLTATSAALDAGTISAAHAKVILRALDDLPEGVTPEQRRECEAELLRLAVGRSPSQLRRAARRVLEAIEPDEAVVDDHEQELVVSEEERALEKAAFWIKDNHDGTMTGRFTVPWASGAALKKVIDAMTAPRRRTGSAAGESGAASESGAPSHDAPSAKDRTLDWQHRRGLAFADLLLRLPTDHLHYKVAATVIISVRAEDLATEGSAFRRPGTGSTGNTGPGNAATGNAATGSAATGTKVAGTDCHGDISAGAARRLACGAGIIPIVLGSDSVPLDLGRQSRLFTDNQRMALAGRYDSCAAEGCDRPFAWTETHHLRAWEHGGSTDLDNAVPLCGTHHRMIDQHMRWSHSVTRGERGTVSIRFHRRT